MLVKINCNFELLYYYRFEITDFHYRLISNVMSFGKSVYQTLNKNYFLYTQTHARTHAYTHSINNIYIYMYMD